MNGLLSGIVSASNSSLVARIYYSANYYDAADRQIATVNAGTTPTGTNDAATAQMAISPHSARSRVMEIRGRLHEWGHRQHSRHIRAPGCNSLNSVDSFTEESANRAITFLSEAAGFEVPGETAGLFRFLPHPVLDVIVYDKVGFFGGGAVSV